MKHIRTGLMIASGAAFAVMAFFTHSFPYFPQDLSLSQRLQLFNGALPGFMYGVSAVSSLIPAIIIVAVIAVCLGRNKHRLEAAIAGTAPAIMALAVVPAIKLLIGRPRPTPELVLVMATDSGNSFPSGHAAFVMVFYGFIIYLLPRLMKNRTAVRVVRGLLIAFIGLTCVSRVYLGLHWTSDVMGGFFLGGLALTIMISIYCYYLPRFSLRSQHAGAS